MNSIFNAAGATLLLATAAQAAWMNPAGGWNYDYQASSGMRPDQFTPAATTAAYQYTSPNASKYAGIIQDNGESALLLNHTGANYALYTLPASVGIGAITDQLTVDFRIRLADTTQPDNQAQFRVQVVRPVNSTKQRECTIQFAAGGLSVIGGTGTPATPMWVSIPLGTDWHEFRLLVDENTNAASLYMDGGTTAILNNIVGYQSTGTSNGIAFGDGSSLIVGMAELSYLKVANELASPVPEPTALSLVALGLVGLLWRRR